VSLYRLASHGYPFFDSWFFRLEPGMRLSPFLYIFPYTTKTSANCFSVAGIKWPNHILFHPMRKKGFGMNELDRVVISGAGSGHWQSGRSGDWVLWIDVSCVSRTTNCEVTAVESFCAAF